MDQIIANDVDAGLVIGHQFQLTSSRNPVQVLGVGACSSQNLLSVNSSDLADSVGYLLNTVGRVGESDSSRILFIGSSLATRYPDG